MLSPTTLDLPSARRRLKGRVHRTPLLHSTQIDLKVGRRVWFKAECLQRTGSFKIRGALNAALHGWEAGDRRGLACVSSGNHGQAVAVAARELGLPALVVMSGDSSELKATAIRGYGAEVYTEGVTVQNREEVCQALASERGLRFVHPHDDQEVMAGQATVAQELVEQLREHEVEAEAVLIPVGGGGLLAGMVTTLTQQLPQTTVIGVEPSAGDDGLRSLRQGELVTLAATPDTLADGARTVRLGTGCWEIIRSLQPVLATVDEGALARSCWWLWTRTKLMVEPTGALTLAALLAPPAASSRALPDRGGDVVCVVSGGNLDPAQVPTILELASRQGGSR
ncbi:MAG: threonine ammonia-lyase [Candidatus Dormibacteria bacterium]